MSKPTLNFHTQYVHAKNIKTMQAKISKKELIYAIKYRNIVCIKILKSKFLHELKLFLNLKSQSLRLQNCYKYS